MYAFYSKCFWIHLLKEKTSLETSLVITLGANNWGTLRLRSIEMLQTCKDVKIVAPDMGSEIVYGKDGDIIF
jgi:hypothetical protein